MCLVSLWDELVLCYYSTMDKLFSPSLQQGYHNQFVCTQHHVKWYISLIVFRSHIITNCTCGWGTHDIRLQKWHWSASLFMINRENYGLVWTWCIDYRDAGLSDITEDLKLLIDFKTLAVLWCDCICLYIYFCMYVCIYVCVFVFYFWNVKFCFKKILRGMFNNFLR
jgi:hypothetical protein